MQQAIKPELFVGKLSVKKSPIHGYGVFANQDFAKGDIIEECHSIFVEDDNISLLNYCFDLNNSYFETKKLSGLPLGYGAIYNHSMHPNADYEYDIEHNLLVFSAQKPIVKGEEIFVSYGNEWFSLRKMRMKKMTKKFFMRNFLFLTLRFFCVFSVILFIVILIKLRIVPFKFF